MNIDQNIKKQSKGSNANIKHGEKETQSLKNALEEARVKKASTIKATQTGNLSARS